MEDRAEYESQLRTLVNHAWDREIGWHDISAWLQNFKGEVLPLDEEQLYCLFMLSRYMYFGKPLVREMLKSLYRDHFKSPLKQRIRRRSRDTLDVAAIDSLYDQELSATRFIGLGSPAESGAHLLYYFRQINSLQKKLFVDIYGAFPSKSKCRDSSVTRYVFFDDLVGSGAQSTSYLKDHLNAIRCGNNELELQFMSLFATTEGMQKLNTKEFFDGRATCLFELDDSFKAFTPSSRYFSTSPPWFNSDDLLIIADHYGKQLFPKHPLGFRNGQLLLSFVHNTPDNAPPIFWHQGSTTSWAPVFVRFDKQY